MFKAIFYVIIFGFWKESWAEIINNELLNFKAGFVIEKNLGLYFPNFHNIGLFSLVKLLHIRFSLSSKHELAFLLVT